MLIILWLTPGTQGEEKVFWLGFGFPILPFILHLKVCLTILLLSSHCWPIMHLLHCSISKVTVLLHCSISNICQLEMKIVAFNFLCTNKIFSQNAHDKQVIVHPALRKNTSWVTSNINLYIWNKPNQTFPKALCSKV